MGKIDLKGVCDLVMSLSLGERLREGLPEAQACADVVLMGVPVVFDRNLPDDVILARFPDRIQVIKLEGK